MSLQVIVATMNQTDYSLLDKMNIQSDAIVCNQCDKTAYTEFDYNGHRIQWFSFAERGVGLNRNNGLMRATADIVLFADDDVVYQDGYAAIIEEYYERHPKTDVAIFNLDKVYDNGTKKPMVTKAGKATSKTVTKYGAVFISARREKLHFHNISFHLQFGGGTTYSCGEDTLFFQDCCKHKLRIALVPDTIGYFEQGESTWFQGYTDKFFFDKGVLYYLINRRLAPLFAFYHCFKHKDLYKDYGWKNGFLQMKNGIMHAKRSG